MWNPNNNNDDEGGLALADASQDAEVRALDGLRSAYRGQGYEQG